MGLTPLEGLPGATRRGTVDPVLPLHISSHQLAKRQSEKQSKASDNVDPFSQVDLGGGVKVSHAELVLNKQSGFKAVAGISDFEEVCKRRNAYVASDDRAEEKSEENRKAALAFDIFVDRIIGYLGSYSFKLSALGGVHGIVFSGGVGEASQDLREALAKKLEHSSLRVSDRSWIPVYREAPSINEQDVKQLSRASLGLQASNETMNEDMTVPWVVCKVGAKC
jgi:acetate kinase